MFLYGASQMKFFNFKNSGLRLWQMNGWVLLSSFPSRISSYTFLTSNDIPMTFCSNTTLCCWGSSTQLSTKNLQAVLQLLWSELKILNSHWTFICLPGSSQHREKEGFLECLCNHCLLFCHPWKKVSTFFILKCSPLCIFILKHKVFTRFTYFVCYLYTVHPTNLPSILVKVWDRTLILWSTDLSIYLCQRRPGTGDDQPFVK